MYTFLTILIVILSLLLIFIVTIQESKGGGLASGFAANNQLMGVRKTTDFLEKTTWTLIASIVVLCIVTTRFVPRAVDARQHSAAEEYEQTLPATSAPVDARPFEAPVTPTPDSVD